MAQITLHIESPLGEVLTMQVDSEQMMNVPPSTCDACVKKASDLVLNDFVTHGRISYKIVNPPEV